MDNQPPGDWRPNIQQVYVNRFGSIWEYEEAFSEKKIDWRSVVGEVCPVCGEVGCWREIAPYERRVIELFPYKSGRVGIQRFQCRQRMSTFSMLPWQLAPYHIYTIESMVRMLLLCRQVYLEEGKGASVAIEELSGDAGVTPWLIRHWQSVVVLGLRVAHARLWERYDLSGIRSGGDRLGYLEEVADYCKAFGLRDPPLGLGLKVAMQWYGRAAGRALIGRPSQERRGLSAA